MKRIRTLAALAGAFAIATAQAQSTMPAVDLSSIAGGYALIAANQEAKDIPPKMVAATHADIGDGKLMFDFGDYRADATVTAIDPAATPATIDLATSDEPSVKLTAIYRLEGDRLSLAYRKDGVRPTSFDTGPGVSLFVFKRGAATTRPAANP